MSSKLCMVRFLIIKEFYCNANSSVLLHNSNALLFIVNIFDIKTRYSLIRILIIFFNVVFVESIKFLLFLNSKILIIQRTIFLSLHRYSHKYVVSYYITILLQVIWSILGEKYTPITQQQVYVLIYNTFIWL